MCKFLNLNEINDDTYETINKQRIITEEAIKNIFIQLHYYNDIKIISARQCINDIQFILLKYMDEYNKIAIK